MSGRRAKAIRREVYGKDRRPRTTHVRLQSGQIVGDRWRRLYQLKKRGLA